MIGSRFSVHRRFPRTHRVRSLLSLIAVLVPSLVSAGELILPPDQVQIGQSAYSKKCASCHGRDASGASGPDVKGILPRDVTMAARGVENMPRVPLETDEAEAIAIFLMSLAPDQAKIRLGIAQ